MSLAITIPPVPTGIAYARGRQLWSGDTNIYHAGDEGSLFAAGWFDYTPPAYPLNYARLATFTTLVSNNIWGNTDRYTDRAGAAPATTGNRIIQDHFTGHEFFVPGSAITNNWNDTLDAAQAFNDGTYSDWELPTELILTSIAQGSISPAIGYSPFSNTVNTWTSSTNWAGTTQARRYNPSAGFSNLAKTSAIAALFVRKL